MAVVVGLILAVVSLVPDIDEVDRLTFQDTLPSFEQADVALEAYVGVVEVRLPTGGCNVFVTFFDAAALSRYNDTGERPAPQLTCDVRTANLRGPLRWMIVENRGLDPEPYEVTVILFAVRSTRAPLALPALLLLFGGSIYLLTRTIQRGVARVATELLQQRERFEAERRERDEALAEDEESKR